MQKVRYLLTYRYALLIQDLTVEFVKRYIDSHSRTKDQMEQAARSGKQNIVEGVTFGQTSKKGEIDLLGVSLGSFEELLSDYEDYLRQHSLPIYPKAHPKVTQFRQTAYQLTDLSNLSDLGDLRKPGKPSGSPEDDANFLLTLCHQITFLLDRQIKASMNKFIEEGGIAEKLYALRKEKLKSLR